MPNDIEQKMTMDRLGQRMTAMDSEMAGVKTEVGLMRGDFAGVKEAVNRLMEYSGSRHATKGMIPVSYVTWAVTTLVALVALGMTMLALAAGVMVYAMSSEDEKSLLQIESMETRMFEDDIREKRDRLQFEQLVEMMGSHNAAQQGTLANIEGRVSENSTELEVFWEWYHPFLVDYGRLSGKVDSLWTDVQSHTGSLDHPGRQTYEIDGIRSQLKQLESTLNSMHPAGSGEGGE